MNEESVGNNPSTSNRFVCIFFYQRHSNAAFHFGALQLKYLLDKSSKMKINLVFKVHNEFISKKTFFRSMSQCPVARVWVQITKALYYFSKKAIKPEIWCGASGGERMRHNCQCVEYVPTFGYTGQKCKLNWLQTIAHTHVHTMPSFYLPLTLFYHFIIGK